MTLASRLDRLELVLRRDDRPSLVVAFTDDDGRLVDATTGEAIALDALGPQTTLVVLGLRPDVPQ